VSRRSGNGSFLADLLQVTRDRIVFTAIEFMKALRFATEIESAPKALCRV